MPGPNLENRFVRNSTNLHKYKAEIYDSHTPKYQNNRNLSKGNPSGLESFHKGKPKYNPFKSIKAGSWKNLNDSKVGLNGYELIRGNLNLSPLRAKNNSE